MCRACATVNIHSSFNAWPLNQANLLARWDTVYGTNGHLKKLNQIQDVNAKHRWPVKMEYFCLEWWSTEWNLVLMQRTHAKSWLTTKQAILWVKITTIWTNHNISIWQLHKDVSLVSQSKLLNGIIWVLKANNRLSICILSNGRYAKIISSFYRNRKVDASIMKNDSEVMFWSPFFSIQVMF